MDIEAEIQKIKQRLDKLEEKRVSELEGSFDFLSQQTKAFHTDLLSRFDKLEFKFDGLESKFDHLREDLPNIIAKSVGDLLRDKR